MLIASIAVIIALGIFIIGIGYIVALYNRIVRRENEIDNAYGSIETNLKKRHDLIPNLISSVKEYMDYESDTLQQIVELRNLAQSDDLPPNKQEEIESQITQALDKLMVQVEDYPDLKASENFMQLQRSLNEVEEQLSASRRFFNSAVKQFNDSIETFPGNLIAALFDFSSREMFNAEVHVHKIPDVGSLLDN